MSTPQFIHLRLHSEFSIADGLVRIDDVVQAAHKDGQPALAMTDLASTPSDSSARQVVLARARRSVKRVVFICVPHRGSPLADNFVATLLEVAATAT